MKLSGGSFPGNPRPSGWDAAQMEAERFPITLQELKCRNAGL